MDQPEYIRRLLSLRTECGARAIQAGENAVGAWWRERAEAITEALRRLGVAS